MNSKLFEIRDAGTLIPVIATRMQSGDEVEGWLLKRAGFGCASSCVFVGKLETQGGNYDPFNWPSGSRTMTVAHDHIEKHFDELPNGAVIDVEFILGLRAEPKQSERPKSAEVEAK